LSTAHRSHIDGPAGRIEIALTEAAGPPRGVALLAHPHPLHGGTLDNKVIQTLAKALSRSGYHALRLNFRGVGASEGSYDEGRGEVEDFLALAKHARHTYGPGELVMGGFSFGAYIAAAAAAKKPPAQLVLVGPAVNHFPVAEVPAHTLVVHGELDDVVPLKNVLDWARPQQLPVVVFPGAGHFFHGALVRLQALVEQSCRRQG
jgi:uncharacterized protein